MINCTYIVPKNNFGIFAYHTEDNVPLDDEFIRKVIEGPITQAEPELLKELSKPLEII